MVLYQEGADGFVRSMLPSIECALAGNAPVLVVTDNARIELLKDALGDDAERVLLADMRQLGRNPGRIIPALRQFLLERETNGTHALGIGEAIWPGRTPDELAECERHESLVDLAFSGGRAWDLLCPYDVESLDDRVIESAQRSHAYLARDGESENNQAYHPAPQPPRPFDGVLPAPPPTARELRFSGEELEGLRHFLSGWAAEERLDSQRTEELVLAVNELATNSIRYGGGRGELCVWSEPDTLLCEVRDEGHISDPLVGRTRPTPEENHGRGLWLVNQLCDLVQIRSSAQGTAVRVRKAVG
jgi:anti-sigma regulatory factor (Ser/Thr protein kinase)